jgi:hypothetical protein
MAPETVTRQLSLLPNSVQRFSFATLLPVLFYTYSLKSQPIATWDGPWRIVPILLGITALFFFLAGARSYDFYQFIGLRQLNPNIS